MKIKLGLVLVLAISWWASEMRADTQAICTPTPPNNAVLINESSCTIVGGNPQMSVTVHVYVVPVTDSNLYRLVLNLSGGKGATRMVAFGTVPIGTTCDGTQSLTTGGTSYFRIPTNTTGIVYSSTDNNRPSVVWAHCN